MPELDVQKLISALQAPDAQAALGLFIAEHNLSVSVNELIAIAKAVCSVTDVVCPIINGL